MNVDTMRRIDRLAGVPLCAAATLLLRLVDLIRPRTPRPVRRILFVELSEMGTEPAMRKARTQLSAELFFVIFARNVGSLQLLGTFPPDNIFTVSDRSIFALARDTLSFLCWARREGIDTVVDFELFSRFTALLVRTSGADRRAGLYRFRNERGFIAVRCSLTASPITRTSTSASPSERAVATGRARSQP